MLRGLTLVLPLLFSSLAHSMNCSLIFRPLQLVPSSSTGSVSSKKVSTQPERELNGKFVELLINQKVVETENHLVKISQIAEEHPFMYEAFENIAKSHSYLVEIVKKNLRLQIRAVETIYQAAGGGSGVVVETKLKTKKSETSNKVVNLAEVREKRMQEEKEEYEAYLLQEYSEMNYGFFRQLYDFFSIIHLKLNSPSVKLQPHEVESLLVVAENFKIYSNYLLSKEIIRY